jgi:hypothetical protein
MGFRPKLAVQSRELTQIQSLLQEQIRKFGGSVYKDGSIVTGCQTHVATRVIQISVANSAFIDVLDLVGTNIVGSTSNTIAKVVGADPSTSTDPALLYVTFINGSAFTAGEILSNQENDLIYVNFTAVTNTDTIVVGIDSGVMYIDGRFVDIDGQFITIPDWANKSWRIGVQPFSEIITEKEDPSLNDPAIGTDAANSPGSTRLKIVPKFVKFIDIPTSREKFYEIIRLDNGVVNKQVVYPIYSDLGDTMARRTFDESGNYTVRAFPLYVRDHVDGDPSKFSVGIESGKAYVNGYEVYTVGTQYIDIDRTTDTEYVPNYDIVVNLGNYCLVSSLTRLFSVETMETVNLYNAANALIGQARVRAVKWRTGSIYQLHLFEVTMSSSNFASVTQIIGVTSNATATIDASGKDSTGSTVLYDNSYDSLLFPCPQSTVAKIRNENDQVDTTYQYEKVYRNVPFSSGISSTLTTVTSSEKFTGSGVLSNTEVLQNYIVVVKTVSSGPFTPGQIIDFSAQGSVSSATPGAETVATRKRNVYVNPTTPSNQQGQMYFDVKENAAFTADILTTVVRTRAGERIKTLRTNISRSVAVTTASPIINIGECDVTSVKVYYAGNATATTASTDVTSNFILDNGQRDNYYDSATIKFIAGNAPLGNYLIVYSFFSHSSDVGYFSVDSYNNIPYQDIPTYTSSSKGTTIRLSDVLDFRPRRTNVNGSTALTDTFSGVQVPVPTSIVSVSMSYYVGRIDKVVVFNNGSFGIVRGTPSLRPTRPGDVNQAMTLATINLPAYAYDPKFVNLKLIDNKRYTMRDIGALEKRINTLEYYNALTLLERSAQSMTIRDEAGLDRFKNGVITDPFSGAGTANVFDPAYICSMDFEDSTLHPAFKSDALGFIQGPTAGVVKTGDLYTLSYDVVTVISQPLASQWISVNPYNVVVWSGNLILNPATDIWIDTVTLPALIVDNGTGRDDALEAAVAADAGVRWNDWQTTWTGVISTETKYDENNFRNIWVSRDTFHSAVDGYNVTKTTTQSNQTRTGITTSVTYENVLQSIGDKVVDTSTIPFIRQKDIAFTLRGCKPLTTMYAFIDDVNISAFVTPTGKNMGDPIVTDSSGFVDGMVRVPNTDTIKFRTGKRLVSFLNTNTNVPQSADSYATTDYLASGTLQTKQETFLSTREPRISQTVVTDSRVLTSTTQVDEFVGVRYFDPVAQSFYVEDVRYPNGMFAHSFDIAFKRKDPNIPVTLEIRPMVNGYPHDWQVLPFGAVTLESSQVSTSDDANTFTRFVLPSPVYLQPGYYAVVLLSNSNLYEVFTAQIGKLRIDGTTAITEQPYIGSFFLSQNSNTWTADQTVDLTFKVNACKFNVGSGSATFLTPAVTPARTIDVTNLLADTITPTGTALSPTYKGTSAAGRVQDLDWIQTFFSQNVQMPAPRTLERDGDMQYKIGFSTSDSWVSPVIDIARLGLIHITNIINNDLTGETNASGGNALYRYISRRMVLADSLDADSFHVYVAAYRPVTSDFKVFAKFISQDDPNTFDSRPWVELPYIGNIKPTSLTENDYRDMEFGLDQITYTSNGATFDTFKQIAVKIVGASANSSIPPLFKDLRGIALT